MRTSSLALVSALLCGGIAACPARADVHQLGDVNISAGHYTHVSWSRFDGPVLRLRFVADNDTVDCEHIMVTYRDGTVHEVFSGVMPRDTMETISFTEGDSHLRNIDFACKAAHRDGARITLSAVSAGDDAFEHDSDLSRDAHIRTDTSAPAR
jgi:hypothetical protein